MKSSEDYLKELFEEALNLEEGSIEGSIEYDFLKVLKKAQIEFTISILEDLTPYHIGDGMLIDAKEVNNKIQELKTYLNEKS